MKSATQHTATTETEFSATTVIIKSTALAIAFVTGSFLVLILIASIFGYQYLQKIGSESNKSPQELLQIAKSANEVTPRESNPVFLILGTDSLATRGEVPPLTDILLLASLDLKSGAVHLLPLPRDLWNENYKTKINALLAYGSDRSPDSPEQFPKQVIEEMTNVPIDFTVVLAMDTLAELVDTLGGVAVSIPTSFVDTEFPNPDVDISTERDPKKLYKTVSFSKGTETMSGERLLEFVRSRHSESEEGTDLARNQRQQIAFAAILDAATAESVIKNPSRIGKLFSFYENHFRSALPINDMAAIGKAVLENSVSGVTIESHSLSIQSRTEAGVLVNPDIRTTKNIWLYQITDDKLFREEVGRALQKL
ncbi:MAG: LCP family protein [bacterium]|nr:LCP family protein [bacterium]